MEQISDNEVIFLMGMPAAGKSTLAGMRFSSTHVFIDCDAIKATHSDYDPKAPHLVHDWSADEVVRIFEAACEVGKGRWVMDGTGSNAERMVYQINQARAAGFTVRLFYVLCDLTTSLRRNARRTRTVPERVVREKAMTIATSFEIVRSYVDSVEVVDNSVDTLEEK